MKKNYCLHLGILAVGGLGIVWTATSNAGSIPITVPHGPANAQVAVCFRPNDQAGCVQYIVQAIDSAKTEIRVQAYNFTTPAILNALVKAKQRGVDVQVILDKVNDPVHKAKTNGNGDIIPPKKSRYTGATFMFNAGIPTFIDRAPHIAHNKLIIIDQHLVIGGSYNYSTSAEKNNAENVTFMDSQTAASWFLKNWNDRRTVSETFESRSQ